jgi:6-phosphogluconolactonase
MKRLLSTYFIILLFCAPSDAQTKKEILYVGTFSVRGSEGIYAYSFDRVKQTLTLLQTVPSLESPSFLTIHPTKKYLYSVNRGKADLTDQGGSVSAYGIDKSTGRLSGLNHKSSYGEGPCYVAVDKTGKFLAVGHYNEGNLTLLSLFKDGQLGGVSDAKKYTGNSINPERQESPHIHAAIFSDDNKFLYVTDLGTDKIYIYGFNEMDGTLQIPATAEVNVIPGAGPRHLSFHPTGNFLYLAEELTSTVAAFSVDKTTGALTVLQDSVQSLPDNFSDKNSSADIHTDVAGKYLYMSNRGADVISIYSIGDDGKITLTGHQNSGGKTPRNFLIDGKGEYLFVANQDTDTINMFRIHPKTGKLSPVGKPVAVPSPVCLKLITLD